MSKEKGIGYKDIFRQKQYMKMILAQLINRFGDSIDAIAFSWIIYEITNNAMWSAIIFGINKLPSILVTPFAGAWVEGRNKKTIIVVSDFVRGACVAFIATGYLMDFLQPWMLVFTTIIISTVEAFCGPASTAILPQILEKKYYDYGMSLMSSLSSISEIVGTAVAAGIIAWIGSSGAIYIDMATFIISGIIISFIKTSNGKFEKKRFDSTEYWTSFKEGFMYVKDKKIIMYLLGVCVFLNAILVPINCLEAPLAKEILHSGVHILSVMSIALTTGMVIGSVAYPFIRSILNGKFIVFLCATIIGLYYIGLIVFRPYFIDKLFLNIYIVFTSAFLGIIASVLMAYLNIEFTKRTDEQYMARTASILTAFSSAATPIISFVVGAIVALVPIVWMFIIAGILGIIYGISALFVTVLDEEKVVNTMKEAIVE